MKRQFQIVGKAQSCYRSRMRCYGMNADRKYARGLPVLAAKQAADRPKDRLFLELHKELIEAMLHKHERGS